MSYKIAARFAWLTVITTLLTILDFCGVSWSSKAMRLDAELDTTRAASYEGVQEQVAPSEAEKVEAQVAPANEGEPKTPAKAEVAPLEAKAGAQKKDSLKTKISKAALSPTRFSRFGWSSAEKLIIAAELGYADVVQAWLNKAGDDPEKLRGITLANGVNGRNALQTAAVHGSTEVVAKLLSVGTDDYKKELLTAKSINGKSALYLAAEYKKEQHTETVKMLLDKSPTSPEDFRKEHLLLKDDNGWTALHAAARSGNPAVVGVLWKGAKDAGCLKDILLEKGKDENTALHAAAADGDYAVSVQSLMDAASDDNCTDCLDGLLKAKNVESYTALHVAVSKSRVGVVKHFCERAFDDQLRKELVEAKTSRGATALHLAAGQLNVRYYWVGGGSKHPAVRASESHRVRDEESAKADEKRRADIVKLVMELAPDVEVRKQILQAKDDKDNSALYLAAADSDDQRMKTVAMFLKTTPADFLQTHLLLKEADDKTALYAAAAHGYPGVVEALCDSAKTASCLKILLQAKDKNGKTALHAAAEEGYKFSIKFLLVAATDGTKCEGCLEEILKDKDEDGNTALHAATKKGHWESADQLLQAASKESCKGCLEGMLQVHNKFNETALDIALKNPSGRKKIVNLINEAKEKVAKQEQTNTSL
eukprot:TRINITY_DN6122_c0_g2_i2.p1 TRINITY_DN6122_c0_g2~~TRINITY_DN6122_c0_g2_i2.p1  ORF type:complete len:652 (+),score=155.23 TRINITY_DN6122_c0_g2_i2:59-2014(+)